MNAADRKALRMAVDRAARERAESGYMDCDPETLTTRADDADRQGLPEVASALRAFRDRVVNPLLGEGWTLARIEEAALRHWGKG